MLKGLVLQNISLLESASYLLRATQLVRTKLIEVLGSFAGTTEVYSIHTGWPSFVTLCRKFSKDRLRSVRSAK